MSQEIGGQAPAAGRPVVEGQDSGVTRGVHGFHKPGDHPFDKENAAAREANGDDAPGGSTATKTLDGVELTGTVGDDGLARAKYTGESGVELEHVWDPANPDAPIATQAEGGNEQSQE